MKLNKFYQLSKFVLFVAMGVLVLVFNQAIMSNDGAILNGIVGTVIAIYGLEGIIVPVVTKQMKEHRVQMLNGGINVLIAIIMIFMLEGHPDELRILCVLWSLWSIMREGEEIVEKGFMGITKHPIVSSINFAESIVVLVFSVMLICAKDHHELAHHAHTHVILLGIELIIEVIWMYAAELESRCLAKFKKKKEDKQSE